MKLFDKPKEIQYENIRKALERIKIEKKTIAEL